MAKTVTHQDLKSFFGEDDHLEVSKNKPFSKLIFELLSEKEPSESELKVFELILNLSIDHGPHSPSGVKVVEAANSGKTISEAVASGVLEINDSHGGAQEQLMQLLLDIRNSKLDIRNSVREYLESGRRMPGFGHRIYKEEDPRAKLILETAKENNLSGEFEGIAREIEKELQSQKGTKLPLNIDGAIAVVLCELGWSPKLGKAVFIIARTPGLCGQFLNSIK